MWTTEHSVETTASAESVWRLWSDVTTWGDWNADIERIEISGPFAPASTIAMTPVGQDIVSCVSPRRPNLTCSSTKPTWARSSCARSPAVARAHPREERLSRTSSRVLSRRPGPVLQQPGGFDGFGFGGREILRKARSPTIGENARGPPDWRPFRIRNASRNQCRPHESLGRASRSP